MARNMVSHGVADCVMVVGFEKMFPGSLQNSFNDRVSPTGTSSEMMKATRGSTNAPGAAQMFGNAGREYMEKLISPSSSLLHLRSTTKPTDRNPSDTAPHPPTSPK